MCKHTMNYISNELNNMELPKQNLKASEIIKMPERDIHILTDRKVTIRKWMTVAACLCFLFIAGKEVYASSIAQRIVRFTNDGFVIGKEQSIKLADIRKSSENNITEGISEVTTETEYNGENEIRFMDLEQVYQSTNMPKVFPSAIINNFKLSEDGINYYHDINGNLTEKKWSATYIGTDNKKVSLYLDYANWKGEEDTRYGSEYSWKSNNTKVKKQKKYVNENGITFAIAKLRFDGVTYNLAVMSVSSYYYYLQFENMEKNEIYKVLDSINFHLN